jgi:hypothetical protein
VTKDIFVTTSSTIRKMARMGGRREMEEKRTCSFLKRAQNMVTSGKCAHYVRRCKIERGRK